MCLRILLDVCGLLIIARLLVSALFLYIAMLLFFILTIFDDGRHGEIGHWLKIEAIRNTDHWSWHY